MSSNELEAMSQSHISARKDTVDVSNLNSFRLSPPKSIPSPQPEIRVRPPSKPAQQIVKSVPVTSGKRRKVVLETSSNPPTGRRTRFASTVPPVANPVKPKRQKNESAEQI